jgi:hypothetical protein
LKAFVFTLASWKVLFLLFKRLKAFVFTLASWRVLFLLLKRLKAFVFALRGWKFLSLLLKRLKVFVFKKVKSSCFCFWMLKVFAHTFGCWMFLLLLLDVKGYYFYSLMLKVLTFGFKCWKFLLFFLDIESFYFYYWMLKVCVNFWSFVYLHILKKNDVKIYFILFRNWLYKFSLIYNDEIFMKGDFLMIIMLHMSCFVFEHLWWLLLFLCYRAELSLISIHQHQNYVYK